MYKCDFLLHIASNNYRKLLVQACFVASSLRRNERRTLRRNFPVVNNMSSRSRGHDSPVDKVTYVGPTNYRDEWRHGNILVF